MYQLINFSMDTKKTSMQSIEVFNSYRDRDRIAYQPSLLFQGQNQNFNVSHFQIQLLVKNKSELYFLLALYLLLRILIL